MKSRRVSWSNSTSTSGSDPLSRGYCAPPDWGSDPLGEFIEAARQNTIATFVNLRGQYDVLAEIDRLYRHIIDNLTQSPEFVAGFFLFRTHSSFRGAVRLCLSGQVVEAHMVLRGCIESALYGFYVAGDRNRQEIWLRRHDDGASRARVRQEFTIRNVMNHLKTTDPKTQAICLIKPVCVWPRRWVSVAWTFSTTSSGIGSGFSKSTDDWTRSGRGSERADVTCALGNVERHT